ncbi:hypothetical protein DL93DRAFT_2099271 [Clavulina sp. PMI_390]|nr:hypothetical protein DL93DRAFT_2099271 [Clavulina sp. PMI_390]
MYPRILTLALGLVTPLVAMAAPTPAADVLTPFGHRPAANVHQVPKGASLHHVGDEVHIIDAAGTVIHKTTPSGNFTKAVLSSHPGTLQTGWIAYAYWLNTLTTPINYFTSTWVVPSTPASVDGQTVFLFNSIEPNAGNAILQPVLQFGASAAGGGNYWAVANWYGINNVYYYTALQTVSTGQSLQGVITLTGSSGSTYNYLSAFSGMSNTMSVTGSAQLTWATETLEAYNLVSNKDFPPVSTTFGDIAITTTAGSPSVTWSVVDSTTDNVDALVLRQGSTNAAIEILYHNL